jgi:DNA polymerase III delta subunit
MRPAETDTLIRQLIGGDPHAAAAIVDRARTSDEPVLLVAAALIHSATPMFLARAAELAQTTRDRQLIAIAAAHLAGDHGRVNALARDHLVDHPDNLIAAWIAGGVDLPFQPAPAVIPHEQENL